MIVKPAQSSNIKNILEKLNTFNSDPENGTTRVLFTEPEVEARKYIKEEMKKNGLVVREDSIGNIFATLEGTDPDLPPVWTGSHIDTVLKAGMFDGMAGVVAGIEAARLIKESKIPHKRNIEVIVYTSEEPTRFGLSCLGSRAMAGYLSLEQAKRLKDKQGNSLAEVLEGLGYDLSKFDEISFKKGEVFAAVELHIEQGAVLESMGLPIGIVDTIFGPTKLEVSVYGKQSHAGGTPMNLRHDAFLACSEIALKVEKLAKKSSSKDTVATVGLVNVIPNASNVISGEVHFSLDIRDSDYEVKHKLIEELKDFTKQLEKSRGVTIKIRQINDDLPTKSDDRIIEIFENSCKEKNISYHKMVSGAFHDSMMVGKFAPIAMIFVPSKDGISHNPAEWTDYDDIAKGTDILADGLLKLSND
ncbi:M20 family metallo-hydrolase [Clostridium tyrobutyricum]|uniref:M20 family metallo-hydrolase n=1 Tax=Clostridium tyrobutyricum TaxID=1519 RepID=UPI001C37EF6E|nr:M20 family metallo-hydrolase [Clostridium tyrobutyricum]MBV4415833.1 M20 family metallo-hydrolase [Clostridium tyrobutyricum]